MPHVIEQATSARARCRGCDTKIAKDELRFGERHPNAYGEGEMTLWFHLRCAAYKRPEAFVEAAAALADPPAELLAAARAGIEHRRLPRLAGAERATTGRARCRHCREPIAQGQWRVALVFFEEFRFSPGGFVHAACCAPYFGTTDIVERCAYFNPGLTPDDLAELRASLAAEPPAAAAAAAAAAD
jgi:hypothetical protein